MFLHFAYLGKGMYPATLKSALKSEDPNVMISVYTCISGNYDRLKKQPDFSDVNYTCFTDNLELLELGKWKNWRIEPVHSRPDCTTPHQINRYHKIFCFEVLPKAKLSIYIDGSIVLKRHPNLVASHFLQSGALIGAFNHPTRKSVLDEFDACYTLSKIPKEYSLSAREYRNEMIRLNFDDQLGLSLNSFLVRREDSPELRELMSGWWHDVKNRCHRDQLALQYSLWKRNLSWKSLDEVVPRRSFLRQMGHRKPGLHGQLLEIARILLR